MFSVPGDTLQKFGFHSVEQLFTLGLEYRANVYEFVGQELADKLFEYIEQVSHFGGII